jgi:glycosyltransferase involved in cell wall biosynthesis
VTFLLLTQYFPPETGAPQNRLYQVCRFLQKKGVQVSVLTAMPNYPEMNIHPEYRGKRSVRENDNGIDIRRCYIYVSKKRGILPRLLNYFSFVLSSAYYGNRIRDEFDFIFCESPPLFLAWTAMFLARRKRARLIFNVSDLWPESAVTLGVVKNRVLLNLAYRLERKVYQRAAIVTCQTQHIAENISSRYPGVNTYWLPNGADPELFEEENSPNGWRSETGFSRGDFICLYAGILGLAQGLEVILGAAELLRGFPEIKFILLGSGPEKEHLLHMKNEKRLQQVYFPEPVSRQEMRKILSAADCAIVPLKDIPLFRGAVPSKAFEAMALGLPLLLGVNGEAKELLIDEGQAGLHFTPEDPSSLADAIRQLKNDPGFCLKLGTNGKHYARTRFNREKIAEDFYNSVLAKLTVA